jgi:hypothetical protein
MMDLARLATTKLFDTPFRWGVVPAFIERDPRRRLVEEFPRQGFERMRRRTGSDKRYETWFRAIKNPTEPPNLAGLSAAWVDFVAACSSNEYRDNLARCLGVSLGDDLLEITVWRYGPGHFLDPHTDIASKRVAHVIYFNEGWNPAWGGFLRILNSGDGDDVAHEVSPLIDHSAIIVRSDNSWHAVSAVADAANDERKSVQISFWKTPPLQGLARPGLEVLESR